MSLSTLDAYTTAYDPAKFQHKNFLGLGRNLFRISACGDDYSKLVDPHLLNTS